MTEVRSAENPATCKQIARGEDDNRPRRLDWDDVKDQIMETALKAKFTQHQTLRQKLLSTEDSILVAHFKDDNYWIDGGNGTGKNVLGKLLMGIRDEMKDLPSDYESEEETEEPEFIKEENTIYFYGRNMRYYEFCNFYYSPTEIDSLTYPTNEHYFQSMKFYPHTEIMEKVRLASTPEESTELGNSRSNPLRSDWSEVKGTSIIP